MALSADTVWEIRTTGSDTNGGGYVSGGVDYSQQDSPQYALTNGQTQGTTVILTPSASSDMIGNIAYIQGGTGSVVAGWYQIMSVSVGVSITVDRSTGLTAGTGTTINIGGCLATIGRVTSLYVGGNRIWIKSGTYTITSTITWSTAGNNNGLVHVEGYGSTRGDRAAMPLVTSSTNSVNIFTISTTYVVFTNLKITSTASTRGQGIAYTTGNWILNRCLIEGTSTGLNTNGNVFIAAPYLYGCEIKGCISHGVSIYAHNSIIAYDTAFIGNGGDGLNGGASSTYRLERCIVGGNSGLGINWAQTSHGRESYLLNSTIAFNNGTGVFIGSSGLGRMEVRNNIIYGNNGWGVDNSYSTQKYLIDCCNNALGANVSGNYRSITSFGNGDVSLSGNPFVNHASYDYSLNNTPGAGAACRAAAFPGAFLGGTTTGYLDIGAVQHQDSGGGGVTVRQRVYGG